MKKLMSLLSIACILFLGVSLTVTSGSKLYADNDDFVRVLVGFKNLPGKAEEAIVKNAGGEIRHVYHLVPAIAITVPQAALEGLRRNPNVFAVDLDVTIYALDQELDNAWGVKHIGSGLVHSLGNKGSGVKVGIIDSGIDYNHPDLDGNYAGGFDFVNNDNDPMDDYGHGTHVSGTVAAEDDGSGVVGVAPQAEIYALKILNAAGSGSFSDAIAALEWCVDNGIQVTNNSYGSSVNPGGIVEAAFNNAAAAGVLNIASAGNSGRPNGKGNTVGYPGRYASVVAVAATDINDNRASFSSTGDAVELAAPGVNIESTRLGGGYISFNGTSMASPHVAGTAALVIASGIVDIDGDGHVVNEVRQRLGQTADDLGGPGRDQKYGFGLVDADEAATPAGPTNNVPNITITKPANNSQFNSSTLIDFAGTASDVEDGDLSGSILWVSNIQGNFGTGASVSVILVDGVHTITSSATDNDGATGDDSITITVGTPPPTPQLSVSVVTDKPAYVNRERAIITVLVTNGSSSVKDASVNVTISTPNGRTLGGSGLTDSNGETSFRYKVNSKRDGAGTFDVEATASKSGYDPGNGSTTFEVN